MIQSQDNGSTFTDPIKVNSNEGDADPAYISPPIRFGPEGEIYVSWGKIVPHDTFWGIGDIRLARSVDGVKALTLLYILQKTNCLAKKCMRIWLYQRMALY